MNVAVSIAGLVFLIIIHEAGHFFVALAVRMRPRKFYLFFPPALAKWTRNGIEYGIGAIPLGGYVKIPGMHRPAGRDLEAQLGQALEEAPWLARELEPVKQSLAEEDYAQAKAGLSALAAAVQRADLSERARRHAERGITDTDDALSPDAYWRAPAWKRIAVIFAGPGTNLVFAVFLLALVFMLGLPQVSRTVEEVNRGSAAASTGLRPGDQIVAVNGRETDSFSDISQLIQSSDGRPVRLTVRRDGEVLRLEPARPRFEEDENRYILGFVPAVEEVVYGPGGATARALDQTWEVSVAIMKSLGRIVTGEGREDVSSPVGIVRTSSDALDLGVTFYLGLLALISLSLALLNLLPLLPLDGGHIAFSILERVRGRAIAREAYERASAVGIAVVLLLFFIGLSNDLGGRSGG